MPTKLLIIGGTGQLGQLLRDTFSSDAFSVLNPSKAILDITNKKSIDEIVTAYEPAFIINAAAYTNVDGAETDKEDCYQINVIGAKNLAIAAANVGAKLICISSDYVFSGDKHSPYTENDVPSAINYYGVTKLLGEQLTQKYCQQSIIIRTSWLFSEYGSNFVKTMLRLGSTHKNLNVVNDQFGGPTYCNDLAKAIFSIVNQLLNQPTNQYWGIYHFAGSPFISWYEFATFIFMEAKRQIGMKEININGVQSHQYITAAKRPLNSCLNTEKIAAIFNIAPSNWQLAIKENIHKFLNKNNE